MSLLAAFAAPAPLVPIVALTTVLAWGVALGMLWLYRASLSKILTGLADLFDRTAVSVRFATVRPFGAISGALRRADQSIIDAFTTYVRGCEITLNLLWEGIADSFHWMGAEIADVAETAANSVSRVVRQSIPSAENRAVARAKTAARPTTTTIQQTTVVTLPRVKAHADILTGRVGALSDAITNLGRRVRANEKRLAAGATAAAVMVALRSMGLGSLRCGNIRRNLRRFCGMNPAVIDGLLVGGLAISGTLSLERMARELLGQMDYLEAALRRGYKEI